MRYVDRGGGGDSGGRKMSKEDEKHGLFSFMIPKFALKMLRFWPATSSGAKFESTAERVVREYPSSNTNLFFDGDYFFLFKG